MSKLYIRKSVTLIFIFVIGFTGHSAAQTIKTGLSVGLNRHSFNVEGGSGALQPGIGLAGTYGLPVILTYNHWSIHTGIYANNLSRSYYFRLPNGQTFGRRSFENGLSTNKIPFLVGYDIISNEKFSIEPKLGFSWLTSRRKGHLGSGSGSFQYGFGSETVTPVEYSSDSYAVNRNKFLAEMGLDITIPLYRSLLLTFGGQYSLGLQPIDKTNFDYIINEERSYSGSLKSRASGWNFNIGITLPVYRW